MDVQIGIGTTSEVHENNVGIGNTSEDINTGIGTTSTEVVITNTNDNVGIGTISTEMTNEQVGIGTTSQVKVSVVENKQTINKFVNAIVKLVKVILMPIAYVLKLFTKKKI